MIDTAESKYKTQWVFGNRAFSNTELNQTQYKVLKLVHCRTNDSCLGFKSSPTMGDSAHPT